MHEMLLTEYAKDNATYDTIFYSQSLLFDNDKELQVSLLQSYYRWRRSILNKGYDVDSNRHRQLAYFGLWKIGVVARYFHALQNHAKRRRKQRLKAEWFYKKLLAQKTLLALISHSIHSKVMLEGDLKTSSIVDNHHHDDADHHSTIFSKETQKRNTKQFPKYILTMGAWMEALQTKADRYYERKLLVRIFHLLQMNFHCAKISSNGEDKIQCMLKMVPSRQVQKVYYETSVETVVPVIQFDQVAYRLQRKQITLRWKLWTKGLEDIRECKYLWASSWKRLRNRISNQNSAEMKPMPLKSSWVKPAVRRRQTQVLQRWMECRVNRLKQNVWNRMKLVLLDKNFNHLLAKRMYDIYLLRMCLQALYQYAFVKMPPTFVLNEDETAVRYADEIDKRKQKSKYFMFWKEITKKHQRKRQYATQKIVMQRNLFLWTKAKWALQHYILHIRHSEQQIMNNIQMRLKTQVFQILWRHYQFRSNYSSSFPAKVSLSFLHIGGRYDVRRTIGKLVQVFHLPMNSGNMKQKHSNYIELWNKLLLSSSAWRALKLYHLLKFHRGLILSCLVHFLSDDVIRLSFLEWRVFAQTQKRRRLLNVQALEFHHSCLLNRMFVIWRKNAQWLAIERQATQVAVEFFRHKTLSYWMPKWRKCVVYRNSAQAEIVYKRNKLMRKRCFLVWRVETLVSVYSMRSERRRPARRVFRAIQQVLLEQSNQRKALLMSQLKSNRVFETHLKRMMDGTTFCVYRISPCRKMDVLFYLDEHLEGIYSTRKEFCFSLSSLLELEYGISSTSSSPSLPFDTLKQSGVLCHEPWQCFSIVIRNKKEALYMATDNERVLETWLQGLLQIMEILQRKPRTFSFKAMRGRMKLRKLCEQGNCSLAKLILHSVRKASPSIEYSTVSEAPLEDHLRGQQQQPQVLPQDDNHHHTETTISSGPRNCKVVAQSLSHPELLIEELNEQILKKNLIQAQGLVSFYLESGRIQSRPCTSYQAEEICAWLQADARILRVIIQRDPSATASAPPPQEETLDMLLQQQDEPTYVAPDLSPLPEDEPISLALSHKLSYIESGRIPSLVPFARVRIVVPGSPCHAAGLLQDDYILSLGRLRFYRDWHGKPFVEGCNITGDNIARWVEKECYHHENRTLNLVILRRTEYYPEDSEVIEDWQTFRFHVLPKPSPRYHGLLGASFEVLHQQFQESYQNIPFAVVTDVLPGSPAARAGFLRNDLILEYGSIAFTEQDNYENAPQQIQSSLQSDPGATLVVVVLRPCEEEQPQENDTFHPRRKSSSPLCMYRLLLVPNNDLSYLSFRHKMIHGMQWCFFLSPGVIGYLDNSGGETVYDTSKRLWAKWMLKTIKKVKVLLKPEDMLTRCRVFADFCTQVAADSKLAGLCRLYKKVDKVAYFHCPSPCYELFCKYISSNPHLELKPKKESSVYSSASSSNRQTTTLPPPSQKTGKGFDLGKKLGWKRK